MPRSACIFTYIFEITPEKYQQDATLFVYLGDGITFVLSGFFIMYTKDSFLYLILLGAITIAIVLYLSIVFPESPKFLFSKNRYDELHKSFETIKKWNGCDSVDVDKIMEDLKESKSHCAEYKGSFFKDLNILIGSREHKRSLIAVVGLWIYAAFNYYMIGYQVKYFPGDVYVNFMTMTIAEVLAPIVLRYI